MEYDFTDLFREYRAWPEEPAYEHIADLFERVRPEHRRRWRESNPTKKGHDQAWRAWKGKNFKLLIEALLTERIAELNRAHGLRLAMVSETQLKPSQIDEDLQPIRDRLSIDCGDLGQHLANVDFTIYNDSTAELVAIVCCKTSLRERLVTTLFWGNVVRQKPGNGGSQLILLTTDEDQQLRHRASTSSKNYALVSTLIDATYILAPSFEETDRIHRFSRFALDIQTWGGGGGGGGG